jgi:hypothetical protein
MIPKTIGAVAGLFHRCFVRDARRHHRNDRTGRLVHRRPDLWKEAHRNKVVPQKWQAPRH